LPWNDALIGSILLTKPDLVPSPKDVIKKKDYEEHSTQISFDQDTSVWRRLKAKSTIVNLSGVALIQYP
jgi:hypothetical protein